MISLRLEPNLRAASDLTQHAPIKGEKPRAEDLFDELEEGKKKDKKSSGFSKFNIPPGKEEVKRAADDEKNTRLIDFEFEI
jgi:hypothetical protein